MAGQDFAQIEATTEADSKTGSMLNIVAIIFIAGFCFAGGYWLGAGDVQQSAKRTDVEAVEAKLAVKDAESKVLQAKIEALQEQVEEWKSKAEQDAHTRVGELSFYKELPKQSVTPAPVSGGPAAKVATKPAVKPAPEQEAVTVSGSIEPKPHQPAAGDDYYHVQLASFRSESDAMKMQQKLAGSGFSGMIKYVDLGEKGKWFRIYAGPFDSRVDAEAAQLKLEQQLKLKGLLVRGQ